MHRIYNIKTKKWETENIFIALNDDLYMTKKTIFGKRELFPISDENYVIHKDIGLLDKNEELVYEGDYIRARVAEDREEIGLVCYAHELSSYVILCVDSDTFYTLGSDVSSDIEVIGNAFDGYDEEEKDGQSTLQESEV